MIGFAFALVGGGVLLALLAAHAIFTSPWTRVPLGASMVAIGAYCIARREQIATRARLARSQKGKPGILLPPPMAYVVTGILCLLNGVLQLLMGGPRFLGQRSS